MQTKIDKKQSIERNTIYIDRYNLERKEESLYKRRIKQSIGDQPEAYPQGAIIPWFSGT